MKSNSMQSEDIESMIDELEENRDETEEVSIALQMRYTESAAEQPEDSLCLQHVYNTQNNCVSNSLEFPTVTSRKTYAYDINQKNQLIC